MSITIKNAQEIEKMRIAGRLASEVLDYITPFVKPGITTGELDKLCHDYMVDVQGCIPAPLHYAPPGHAPYPKSICTSVNHQVCHGVPGEKKLKPGDVVNLDITVIKEGWHGDTSRMFYVGEPNIQARRLTEITYECMWKGIAVVRAGRASGRYRRGHPEIRRNERLHRGARILRSRHRPKIPRRTASAALRQGRQRSGAAGRHDFHHRTDDQRRSTRYPHAGDGWTVVTKDHALSAQWEHTVLVTETGFEVLTLSAGSPAIPAFIAAPTPHPPLSSHEPDFARVAAWRDDLAQARSQCFRLIWRVPPRIPC
jgi:methionyl aminopeptidase